MSNSDELLKLAQKRLSSLLRSLPVGIAIITAEGTIEVTSRRMLSLLGYDDTELIGRNVTMLVANPPWGGMDGFSQWCLAHGEVEIELEARAKSEELVPVDFSVSPLDADRRGRYVAVMQDVTERFAANQLKQDLYRMINHDVRSPLNAVWLFLESLRVTDKYGSLSEFGKQRVETALSNVDRVVGLVNGLLQLAAIESRGAKLETVETSLARLVDSATAGLSEQSDSKGIKIQSSIGDCALECDSSQLVQVLVNLIANAIDHSPQNSIIEVTGGSEHGGASLTVRDFGPGIPPDEIASLFEPFRQGRQGKSSGFGLGLAIAKQIIVRHGGTINCANAPGGGSAFSFTIPLKQPRQLGI
jgi:PAS domain S-box-containing protein